MPSSEITAPATAPQDDHFSSEGSSTILITPQPAPAASRFLAADAPSTNLEAAPAKAAHSSLPPNTNTNIMTMSQDDDAPALPERPSSPIREPTPTVNLAPAESFSEDPQVASLQAMFPDFDAAVL